jgi:hypothetical protein
VSVTVSVLTLTYIALGRYNATARPFKFHMQSNKSIQVKIAIAVIWLVALVFSKLQVRHYYQYHFKLVKRIPRFL